MTKQQTLDLLMLLSAVQSWRFSEDKRMPDYLLENLLSYIEVLRKEMLG